MKVYGMIFAYNGNFGDKEYDYNVMYIFYSKERRDEEMKKRNHEFECRESFEYDNEHFEPFELEVEE